jgi:hypothetical protein
MGPRTKGEEKRQGATGGAVRKQILMLAIACVCGAAAGCKATGDIRAAAQDVNGAAAQVKDGASALAEGMKQFDPAGINKLLNENKDLREQLALVQQKLATAERNTLTVNLVDGSLRLVVDGYSGRMVVSGWVDNEDNIFAKTLRYDSSSPQLSVSVNLAESAFNDWYDSNFGRLPRFARGADKLVDAQFTDLKGSLLLDLARTADANYKSKIAAAFAAYVAQPGSPPRAGSGEFYLHERLQTKGFHRVYLKIVPERADSSGGWMFRYRLVHERKNGGSTAVFQGNLDSALYPTQLGKPLTEVVGTLYVTAD